MKIEFKKVPNTQKEFELNLDSVKFSGTFSKISQRLAKIDGNISGEIVVDCYKCGEEFPINLDEKQLYLLSDGPFDSENEREDELVIEIDDHMVDFDELLKSELESIKIDYHVCDKCDKDTFVDVEY